MNEILEKNRRLKKKVKELEEVKKEFEEFKAKHAQTVTELRKALKILLKH